MESTFVFTCTPILVQPGCIRDARFLLQIFFSLNILMLRFFFCEKCILTVKIFCVDSRVLSLPVFRVHISEKTVGLVFDKRKLSCTRTHNHLKSLCNFPFALRNSARTYYHSLEKSTKNPKKKLKNTLWTLFSIFQYNCKWLVISFTVKNSLHTTFFSFQEYESLLVQLKRTPHILFLKGVSILQTKMAFMYYFFNRKTTASG